eukprot:gene9796-biopygen8620
MISARRCHCRAPNYGATRGTCRALASFARRCDRIAPLTLFSANESPYAVCVDAAPHLCGRRHATPRRRMIKVAVDRAGEHCRRPMGLSRSDRNSLLCLSAPVTLQCPVQSSIQ